MGIDRATAVKKADDLAREGKLDLAIEEYLRLVEDQPSDFGAANTLGDLYAKAGNKKLAVAQFVQIGDSHRDSGFIPKAVAFYKKALKVDPGSDHALLQLAQIAIDQELFADATLYLNRLLQRRREQGNEAGVAECIVRLGGFPTANAEAKMAAARAAAGHFTAGQAARLWIEAADALERAGRAREAVDVLFQAHSLDSEDAALQRRLAAACANTGQIERAGALLTFDTAGDHPDLLLAFAEKAIREGRDDEARRALRKTIEVAPERRVEAETMLAPLVAVAPPPSVETAADELEIALDDEPAGEATTPAESPLGGFVLETTSQTAVAPDLDPAQAPVSVDSSSVDAPKEEDADAAFAEEEAGSAEEESTIAIEALPAASSSSEFEWSALLADDESEAEPEPEPAVEEPPVSTSEEASADDDVFVLAEEEAAPEPEPVAILVSEAEPEPPFEPGAAPEPEPVARHREPVAPMDEGMVAALTAAAENPALQFQAAAQLGRLLLRAGRAAEGIGWLERASQATTSARDQRLDVMYELADALERHGSAGRALEVFADLDLDAASFRDVPARMVRLRQVLEGGGST